MAKQIVDEFTHMPISRQRKYQLRNQRDGRCSECGEPAPNASRCLKHLTQAREEQRTKRSTRVRYTRALSYRLEQAAKGYSPAMPAATLPTVQLLPAMHLPRRAKGASNLAPQELVDSSRTETI
jgi:hypothetical protein